MLPVVPCFLVLTRENYRSPLVFYRIVSGFSRSIVRGKCWALYLNLVTVHSATHSFVLFPHLQLFGTQCLPNADVVSGLSLDIPHCYGQIFTISGIVLPSSSIGSHISIRDQSNLCTFLRDLSTFQRDLSTFWGNLVTFGSDLVTSRINLVTIFADLVAKLRFENSRYRQNLHTLLRH